VKSKIIFKVISNYFWCYLHVVHWLVLKEIEAKKEQAKPSLWISLKFSLFTGCKKPKHNGDCSGLVHALGFHKINIVPYKKKVTYERMKENISTDKLSIICAMSFIVHLHTYHDITFSLNNHVMNLEFLEERVWCYQQSSLLPCRPGYTCLLSAS